LSTEIKIIRLVTGEDLIAYVTFKDDEIILENALNIMAKNIEGNNVILFYPWLPIEIVEDSVSIIRKEMIMTMVDPKMKIIEKYFSVVEELAAFMRNKEEDQNLEEQSSLQMNYSDIPN
jgi:hypothetical protein